MAREIKMNTSQAIRRSISHNEIVTIKEREDTIADLTIASDGDVESGDVHEFWAQSWRVHVQLAERVLYSVLNQYDDSESESWECNAMSSIDAAHQYLTRFWGAERWGKGHPLAGQWWSPSYEGDIDGADLEISISDPTGGCEYADTREVGRKTDEQH